MRVYSKSAHTLTSNKKYIPGGTASLNRAVQPEIALVHGEGACVRGANENKYIDYHSAFAPHILGHIDPFVTGAVGRVLRVCNSLLGWVQRFSKAA